MNQQTSDIGQDMVEVGTVRFDPTTISMIENKQSAMAKILSVSLALIMVFGGILILGLRDTLPGLAAIDSEIIVLAYFSFGIISERLIASQSNHVVVRYQNGTRYKFPKMSAYSAALLYDHISARIEGAKLRESPVQLGKSTFNSKQVVGAGIRPVPLVSEPVLRKFLFLFLPLMAVAYVALGFSAFEDDGFEGLVRQGSEAMGGLPILMQLLIPLVIYLVSFASARQNGQLSTVLLTLDGKITPVFKAIRNIDVPVVRGLITPLAK